MVKGEADDLIRRIENLELKQLHAQKEKIKNREKKIRLIGADKLYTHSPEDLVIEAEEKKPIKAKRLLKRIAQSDTPFASEASDLINTLY